MSNILNYKLAVKILISLMFIQSQGLLAAEIFRVNKANPNYRCEISLFDVRPSEKGLRAMFEDRVTSLLKDSNSIKDSKVLNLKTSDEEEFRLEYQLDKQIHFEIMKQMADGAGVHVKISGSQGNRAGMVEAVEMLLRHLDFSYDENLPLKAVYLNLRQRILPPIGAERRDIENAFGAPDRLVTATEPITNVPLPHHQYDVAASDDESYFVCVKYKENKAAWVYLANVDESGTSDTLIGEIDYLQKIRKLKLLEALYQENLEKASWYKTTK